MADQEAIEKMLGMLGDCKKAGITQDALVEAIGRANQATKRVVAKPEEAEVDKIILRTNNFN